MSFFLFEQSERLLTINVIPGVFYKHLPLVFLWGSIFVAFYFLTLFFLRKNNTLKRNEIILLVVVAAWLPLFASAFYNNLYDTIENFRIRNYSSGAKRVVRYCNLDNRENTKGMFCLLNSATMMLKKVVPENSKVAVVSQPVLKPYLRYYILPELNYVTDLNQTEYVLVYYPEIGYQDVYDLSDFEKIKENSNGLLVLKRK